MPKFRSSFGGMTSASKIKIQRVMYIYIYTYIPRTQMTRVLIGISAFFFFGGGLTFKNRGHWCSRYIYNKKPVVGTIEVYN